MSLYGALFGANEQADVLLATLGLTRSSVGRFRDVTVAEGKIAVYTRNGGGNRECWGDGDGGGEACPCVGCFMTYHVHKLPHYSHDCDDEFDSTYATIFFNFPLEYAEALSSIDSGQPWDPDARWETMIDNLRGSAA